MTAEGQPEWQLIRALSRLAGLPGLPEKIRLLAAEAALEANPAGAIRALGEAWLAAEADAAEVKPLVTQLNDRHKADKDAIALVRDVLSAYAEETNKHTMDGGRFVVKLTPGRQAARVTDITKLPARFKKIEESVRQRELTEAVIRDGEVIDGVAVTNGAPFVTITAKRHIA